MRSAVTADSAGWVGCMAVDVTLWHTWCNWYLCTTSSGTPWRTYIYPHVPPYFHRPDWIWPRHVCWSLKRSLLVYYHTMYIVIEDVMRLNIQVKFTRPFKCFLSPNKHFVNLDSFLSRNYSTCVLRAQDTPCRAVYVWACRSICPCTVTGPVVHWQ